MNIHDLFERDINRSINGVVKVQDTREDSLKQELEEYVVARELRRHFDTFFETYATALDTPTDKIGVWISGHFGSGKSHFLKMLSYLLENDQVAGKRAIDYFDGKIEDTFALSRMRRCCEVPTETILFSIDTIGGQFKSENSKTALLRSFERMFFEHLGFYGEDLKLAKLEKYIDEQGKTQAFRDAYQQTTGESWVEDRESYLYHEDDIVPVLTQVMGMSEGAARNWFNGTEDAEIAPDRFVSMINNYVDARAKQNGGNFRLLFMADEVGQYIDNDVSLMLNLQTLVEEIGSKCAGRVWVMVTSPEAIDKVTMVVGNDFSKIQGRFNTRLSLSSSSVDEVIQRRVLEKTAPATVELERNYETSATVLKNLFAFIGGSRSDLIGYATAGDYVACYPFVNYQFKVLPDVMEAIRKHGLKAKHISTGERSMLSAFSESVQAVQNEQVGTLVPFWRFFDTIAKDLEHGVIQVVDRATRAAEDNQGLEAYDVCVLKLLYLIRYIDYVKSNLENISILMIDQVDVDKAMLKAKVQDSLDRLVRENYVARQGETYNFLTDEEQDIARAISAQQPDVAQVVDAIKQVLYSDVYTARKLRRGANDFPIDRYVDDNIYGGASQGGMKLNVVTMADDLSHASNEELVLRSAGEALVVLSDECNYFDVLMNSAKIKAYVRTFNREQLPASTQQILTNKQREAKANEAEAASLIREAVLRARCAVDGRMVEVRATKAEDVFEQVLTRLADTVFDKAGYVTAPARDDSDIARALAGQLQQPVGIEGETEANARACKEVADYLHMQKRLNQPTTMGELQRKFQQRPFGWREIDIACVAAQLIADGRMDVAVAGTRLAAIDRQMLTYLRGKQADKAQVSLHVRLDDGLLKQAAEILRDLVGVSNVPTGEAELVSIAIDALKDLRDRCTKLTLKRPTGSYPYPGRDVLDQGIKLLGKELENQNDPQALLKHLVDNEDTLLDWSEDFEQVWEFFDTQRPVFDKGAEFMNLMKGDGQYLGNAARAAEERVEAILTSEKPYKDIRHISELIDPVLEADKELVAQRQSGFLAKLEEEINRLADDAKHPERFGYVQEDFAEVARDVVSVSEREKVRFRERAHEAKNLNNLDALEFQFGKWCAEMRRKLSEATSKKVPLSNADVPDVPERVCNDAGSKVKNVGLMEIAPLRDRLSSEDDVDLWLEDLRAALLEELEGVDAIELV